MPKFQDHFSAHAGAYREYRPSYPRELFAFLAGLVEHHDLAWDCATGNGQAAVDVADYFDHVIATDASQNQIDHAVKNPHVEYRLALAESSGLDDRSVNLITVAQALHWFRLDEFYQECRRVGAPGSVLAVWGYAVLETKNSAIDAVIRDFYSNVLIKGDYWPLERHHLDENYASIPFPFELVAAPEFKLRVSWNLEQFVSYLNTWSAVQRYEKQNSKNPIDEWMYEPLVKAWRDPEQPLEFSTPLILKVGRI